MDRTAALGPAELPGAITLPPRFRLDREIGRGGMATVYLAHDHHLDRFVAIKVLASEWSRGLGTDRFHREIGLMARLVHPGIVALFDSGEVEGRRFYVMPFVTGETLRARLTRTGPIPFDEVAALGADIAEALAYAHGFGIVHRDVKPENIFSVSGRAVLADFGIARVAGLGEENSLTTAGVVVGTLSYMSPEQATAAADLNGRSDLYSLGCVLYELLTGTVPFVAATPLAIMAKHLTETPRAPSSHGVLLPAAMDAIIMQLLAKDPAERPEHAGNVALALRAMSQHTRTTAVPSGGPDPVSAQTAGGPATEVDRLVAEGRRAFRLYSPQESAKSRTYLDEAKAYLGRALTLDPRHAHALSLMGNWYFVAGLSGLTDREEALTRGRELILEALAADDRIAEVHCSMAKLALYSDDDFQAAAHHVECAIELDPSDREALRLQSIVLKILGRTDDAVDAARAATERAPREPVTWNALGDALMAAGRNAEAVDALKRAISLRSGYGPALERLEIARTRLGEHEMALEIRSSRVRLSGDHERADLMDSEAVKEGAAGALERDLRRELDALLAEAAKSDPFAEYFTTRTTADRIVMLCAKLGEWHSAMDWIEQAYVRRPGRLRRMLTDLPFDRRALAVDARYARLLRVAGLEELI